MWLSWRAAYFVSALVLSFGQSWACLGCMVRFSVCMAGASKARFVHILCREEYFCVIFLGGLLYHCELRMVFGGKGNCCAGCHPCDLCCPLRLAFLIAASCRMPKLRNYPHVSFFLGLTKRTFARCFQKWAGRVHTIHF